jgi:hypothetical protein
MQFSTTMAATFEQVLEYKQRKYQHSNKHHITYCFTLLNTLPATASLTEPVYKCSSSTSPHRHIATSTTASTTTHRCAMHQMSIGIGVVGVCAAVAVIALRNPSASTAHQPQAHDYNHQQYPELDCKAPERTGQVDQDDDNNNNNSDTTTTTTTTCGLMSLSDELLTHVISYLQPGPETSGMFSVNRRLQLLMESDRVWEALHRRWFGHWKPPSASWRMRCAQSTLVLHALLGPPLFSRWSRVVVSPLSFRHALTDTTTNNYNYNTASTSTPNNGSGNGAPWWEDTRYVLQQTRNPSRWKRVLRMVPSWEMVWRGLARSLVQWDSSDEFLPSWQLRRADVDDDDDGDADALDAHGRSRSSRHADELYLHNLENLRRVRRQWFWAARNGHDAIVDILIRSHSIPDLDLREEETGMSALHIAAHFGQIGVAHVLLHNMHESQVDSSCFGTTPLHLAAEKGFADMVQLLVAHSADVARSRYDGAEPLYLAAQHGCCNVARVLLACGANANATFVDGSTPLYAACKAGHSSVVELLLSAKADVNRSRELGHTPLYIACLNGRADTVSVLLRSSALSNACIDYAPLIAAARSYGQLGVTEILETHKQASTQMRR